MRALKEELIISDSDVQVPVDQYMHFLELGLKKLTPGERQAVFLRFWEPFTIAEVAGRMHLSWEDTDRLIESGVEKIRKTFRKELIAVQAEKNTESEPI